MSRAIRRGTNERSLDHRGNCVALATVRINAALGGFAPGMTRSPSCAWHRSCAAPRPTVWRVGLRAKLPQRAALGPVGGTDWLNVARVGG
jgi:hypothetical protein